MTQITQDLKDIIQHLDEAAKLAKRHPYTAELAERLESLADVAQERLEEA